MASDQVWNSQAHYAQDSLPPAVPAGSDRSRLWRRPISKAAAILLPVLLTWFMGTGFWGTGLDAITYPDAAGHVTEIRRSGYSLLTDATLYRQTWVAGFGACVVVLAALLMMSLPFQKGPRIRAAGYVALACGLLCAGYFAFAGTPVGDDLPTVLGSLNAPDSVYWNLRTAQWTSEPGPPFLIAMLAMFAAYTVCERRTRSVP